jgi:hypothetical protein
MSCGGSTPPPQEPEDEAETAFRRGDDDSGMGVSSEVGGLNQQKARRVFKQAQKDLIACLNEGARRIEYLAGDVRFFVAVDTDGSVKSAHLSETTLGDRQTETCLLDVLRAREWPKPVGGKVATAESSIGFDHSGDVRPPEILDYEAIAPGVESVQSELDACKPGGGSFFVTMYIDKEGAPIAAGAAPPDGGSDSAVDCIVGVLMGAKFPSPGGYVGKVGFQL